MFHATKYGINLTLGPFASVDEKTLSKLANWIGNKFSSTIPSVDWRNSDLWPEDDNGQENVSQFFTLGNAINFRYWDLNNGVFTYCEGSKGGKQYRGALYMWRCLKEHCEKTNNSLLDANVLSEMKEAEIRQIFKDDTGHDIMPALDERLLNWRDLGKGLQNAWKGSFFNLVRASNGSLLSFVNFCKKFRAFDDPLCKLTMVNAIMHVGRGLADFDDRPFPAIDYELLKQLMRNGIVLPSPTVAKKLESTQVLTQPEALDLRKAALYSFIRLMEETKLPGDVLDNKYWFNRTKCKTDVPVCRIGGREHECIFFGACNERVEIGLPLELTRYY